MDSSAIGNSRALAAALFAIAWLACGNSGTVSSSAEPDASGTPGTSSSGGSQGSSVDGGEIPLADANAPPADDGFGGPGPAIDSGVVGRGFDGGNPPADPSRVRTIVPFDDGWLFFQGDAVGADQPGFADVAWRALSVPHDWSIESMFVASNTSAAGGGFATTGVGWYRKHFVLPSMPATTQAQRILVEFDGVMANSDVYINGFHLGNRPYGYVSFRYEITTHVMLGGMPNVISVRVDNSKQPASRWYAGAGIYRHVRLIASDPVHVDQWATFVTTPVVGPGTATVHVKTSVVNQGSAAKSVVVQAAISDPSGAKLPPISSSAQSIAPGASADFGVDVPVTNPALWGIDSPSLYRLVTNVQVGGATVDDDVTPFGIRTIAFDGAKGFLLNGVNLKIKGAAMHHDASGLGTAVPLRAWQRRAARLKALGVNAIRTSHNPIAPEVLDLYDRMGLLVLSEFFDAWNGTKQPFDYGTQFGMWSTVDLTDTLKRDRNHPSIALYSIGNEIRDTLPSLATTAASLVKTCHTIDPTRMVTMGLFRPGPSEQNTRAAMLGVLDVYGDNYRPQELLDAQKTTPMIPIVETESTKTAADWVFVRDNPSFSGYFLWTGVDYLGESITPYPDVAKIRGLLDRVGTPYAVGLQHAQWWSTKPVVHITTGGGNATVYSNCVSVELFAKGASLGSKTMPADKISPAVWTGASGALKAVCSNDPQVFDEQMVASGPAAKVVLTVDHASLTTDWNDVSYVKATVADSNGAPIIGATNLVTFAATGPGTIVAVDSASLAAESFRGNQRKAFGGDETGSPTRSGECFALVQASASGAITITASSQGLAGSSIMLQSSTGPFVPCSGTCD
ncbi:MAG: glycoside hydrolase family 2 [Myxococcota bacterium]|nr:glycoside hydrolase family 2 [Myxococcota bacterium]